jgi:simple sugar transport system ATP-binding protein/ribose transport system ATP-binding protein
MAEPHVQVVGISKRFGGVQALADVSVTVDRGEIHGLVGENGAGKSTLGKIIAGALTPDGGELRVAGRAVSYRAPRDALADGLTLIAQEISLVPGRSVIENVYLGREANTLSWVDRGELRRLFVELNERAGFGLPADVPAGALRLADQQKVEILRALARNSELIVMDEPTAALTADESSRLFEIVRRLKEQGTTIVYVSHFLEEVLALVDSVTVLKDGQLVRTSQASQETPDRLVTAMLGRSLELAFPEKTFPSPDAPVVLSVRNLSRAGTVDDVSFDVRSGEIVGLAGLIGSGRSEVARAIFGADRRDGGEVELDGRPLNAKTPRQAIRAGVAMLPESRKDQGLHMERSLVENVTLPHLASVSRAGLIGRRTEQRLATKLMQEVDVRAERVTARVLTLSGGNQQKVLFAKWLFRRPKLLIADEPTRGVDVGAKQAIYQLIHSLAAEGMGVVLISSEQVEVLGLAHRVLVMRGGRVVAEFDGHDVTEDQVMSAAFATEAVA